MPRLTIITRDGESHEVEARVGWSVMENIRDHGFDELLALRVLRDLPRPCRRGMGRQAQADGR